MRRFFPRWVKRLIENIDRVEAATVRIERAAERTSKEPIVRVLRPSRRPTDGHQELRKAGS